MDVVRNVFGQGDGLANGKRLRAEKAGHQGFQSGRRGAMAACAVACCLAHRTVKDFNNSDFSPLGPVGSLW
ncbi:hypothetical protein GCM10008066_13140 [Oxalicibacterium faecigallinarum]|uniref:Uncharacterized protein n=1 Tax=Oxalicibacterium faecigallinarum TaxID=573741 RepID=A0A8J3AQK9_9BURK|nr:hypothetical protein GCM10008066_13140 [Oxalicibacterium faecigallinarum]